MIWLFPIKWIPSLIFFQSRSWPYCSLNLVNNLFLHFEYICMFILIFCIFLDHQKMLDGHFKCWTKQCVRMKWCVREESLSWTWLVVKSFHKIIKGPLEFKLWLFKVISSHFAFHYLVQELWTKQMSFQWRFVFGHILSWISSDWELNLESSLQSWEFKCI